MIDRIYVLNHLPSKDNPRYQERKKAQETQIKYLEQFNIPVWYLNINNDCNNFNVIETINKERLHPVFGRNIILNHFYNSDSDEALFLENDVLITKHTKENKNNPKIELSDLTIDMDYDVLYFDNCKFKDGAIKDYSLSKIVANNLINKSWGGAHIFKNFYKIFNNLILWDSPTIFILTHC